MSRSPSRRRRIRIRRGKTWRWLGLGALSLGAVATMLLRRRPEGSGATSRSTKEPQLDPTYDPQRDLEAFWIPGPEGGSLRVGERRCDNRDDQSEAALTVIFVHALGGSMAAWSGQLADPVEGVHRVAFDLPGHGESDPFSDGDYSVPGLSRALAAVIDHLGRRRVVLVGHSLGAAIAIAYAGRHPHRVEGLLLVDPSGDQTRLPAAEVDAFLDAVRADPLGEMTGYYRQILLGSSPQIVEEVLDALSEVSGEVVSACIEGSVAYDPLPDLTAYSGLRLSVISDLNSLPISLHNLLPDLPFSRVADTSHWLMMDRPAVFAGILEKFLNQILDNATAARP